MIEITDYVNVKEEIPYEIQRDSILNIITNNVTSYTHGFHKYPAKFIPHIPRWAINKYLSKRKNQTVLDPFCGSGTTLAEGMLAGHNVIGIDIDPLSSLISKVKITIIDISKLNQITDWLAKKIKKRKRGKFKPECETIKHWFDRDTIEKLSVIRSTIDEIPDKFGRSKKIKDIQELLFICFSSILRRTSRADNESQKAYVSHTKTKIPEEPLYLFLSQLNFFKTRIKEYSKLVDTKLKSRILCTTSTESLQTILKSKHIDLVITSPPYIKAIDYIYNQMVELFWIGDLFGLQTQTKQNRKKGIYIGTKHIYKKEFSDYTPFNTPIGIKKLDEKIKEVFTTDKKNGHKHAYITFKYFADMEKHFKEISRCLEKGTHYILVVGNSSVSDILFATSDFLISIIERNGFKLMNKWRYKIKNRYMRFDRKGRGGIIKYDWVLDLIKI